MVLFDKNVPHACHISLSVCQVFLREVERQRLQDLLHQEVLRRIVHLQRRFRALLERRNFLRMRQAACHIQVCARSVFTVLPDVIVVSFVW